MGTVCLSLWSRSTQIWEAARLLAIGWVFAIQLWILFEGDNLTLAYLVIDCVLVWGFYKMSRGHWFPVPLFFLQIITVIFHLYILMIEQSPFWMLAFLNRTFEVAIAYTALCAVYRVYRRRMSA